MTEETAVKTEKRHRRAVAPGECIKLQCTSLLKHSLGGQCLSILCDNVEGFACLFLIFCKIGFL